jgi:hypothetical protein
MHHAAQRKILYLFITLAIGLPIAISFWNAEIGVPLLLLGLFLATRAARFGVARDYDPNAEIARRHRSETGRTILVQVVDRFGRDLPPAEIESRLAEAQAKASPRDTIVPVRFVLDEPKGPAAP